jgi:hypothetical protein
MEKKKAMFFESCGDTDLTNVFEIVFTEPIELDEHRKIGNPNNYLCYEFVVIGKNDPFVLGLQGNSETSEELTAEIAKKLIGKENIAEECEEQKVIDRLNAIKDKLTRKLNGITSIMERI